MSHRKAVLLFTNSDFGQANVFLATTYELLRQDTLDIHIASWPQLQPRLDDLAERVQQENPDLKLSPIQFHNLADSPGLARFLETLGEKNKADVPHPPGRLGAERIAMLTSRCLTIWEPEQHLSIFDWSADLARQLDPALIVVDPFLVPVHDMARTFKRSYAVLTPCSLADGLIPQQPWFAAWWKYPAFATGFEYPLPWGKVIDNVICNYTAKKCIWDPRVQNLNRARYAHGIKEPLGTFTPWVKDVPHISPSLEASDLPMEIPPNVHTCGPILLASEPLSSADPGLFDWLQRKPTVLMVLGTHFEAYGETVREQALGLRVLLDTRPDIQVLWKLKVESTTADQGRQNVDAILGQDIKSGRVRIESWLKADPISILTSGHVVCVVHHGGANAYFEAVWAAVPQVVLPMWYDTFDYATRVEYLGIGHYGNRWASNNCPVDMKNYRAPVLVNGKEFGDALVKTVGTTKGEAETIRDRAAALGELCRKSGGRRQAAAIITELCHKI